MGKKTTKNVKKVIAENTMRSERLSTILTVKQEEDSHRLDWFLIIADKEIGRIHYFFQRLELLDEANRDTHARYNSLISFKINQIFHLIVLLEKSIYDSTFDYYQQNYGPNRNKTSFSKEKEIILSFQFESFLAQVKSLIDFHIRHIFEIKLKGKIKDIDSFEGITRKMDEIALKKYQTTGYKNAKAAINILKKEKALKLIFENFDTIYNLKNYRDYIIHHGAIKQEKKVVQAEKYVQYNYYIPKIKRLSNKKYQIDTNSSYPIDIFIRIRFLEILYIIRETTKKLIDNKELKRIEKEILQIDKKVLKDALSFFGDKLRWNDKSFLKKTDVDKILNEMGLDFNDLVIESIIDEREMENSKSADGKDMSYLIQRTFYKPINGKQFRKLSYIYDREWKPKVVMEDNYSFSKPSFKLEDISIPKKEGAEILAIFAKLGILIEIGENKETRYEFSDTELQHYVASLLNLSQYKWSFIQWPEIQYFRNPTRSERKTLSRISGRDSENNNEKNNFQTNRLELEYKAHKERLSQWEKFKKDNNLNVKGFQKNNLNYREISENFDSGVYKEIRENWGSEYRDEGCIDVFNKEKTQVADRIFLLDYLHELNTDFKSWKEKFSGKKLDEVKKIAKKLFNRKKVHFYQIQKKSLIKCKKEYTNMILNERKNFSKVRRKYSYLNRSLKLICPDFFSGKVKFDGSSI